MWPKKPTLPMRRTLAAAELKHVARDFIVVSINGRDLKLKNATLERVQIEEEVDPASLMQPLEEVVGELTISLVMKSTDVQLFNGDYRTAKQIKGNLKRRLEL